ncbi:MAG TPA: glycosyl hydrolase family 28 protein [Verrucomicrobiae bacterium]|nr:glycosyl hydrolase family 28 protein [Verrucomicrobiae bacterium]
MSISRLTVLCAGLLLPLLGGRAVAADPPLPSIPSRTTNAVVNFGAIGNGTTDNAGSINAAITAIANAGGGTVVIEPGSTSLTNYLCGPITMKSKVNLQIVSNSLGAAKLQMLPMGSWPSASTPFIFGNTLTDVEISGNGILDGQGTNWWYPLAGSRPNFVQFDKCTKVWVRDVTLQNPPTFTIYLKNGPSVSITVEGITINTPYDSHNTDAFDISSTNILIRNSFISTGDDDVELGGSSQAATDITISNCTFGTGHGVSCGSKIGGGVNNVLVSNCWWVGTEYGIKMKSDRGSGGLISNMKYLDLNMTNVNIPIAFYANYGAIGSPSKYIHISPEDVAVTNGPQTVSSSTPQYRNITISNLTAVGNSGVQGPGTLAVFMYGLPEMLISNVAMYNVNILGRTNNDGACCIYDAQAIRIIDSNLTAPLTDTNVLTLYNADVTITNTVPITDTNVVPTTNLITIAGFSKPPTNCVLGFINGRFAIVESTLYGTGPFTLGGSTVTFNPDSVNFSNTLNIVSASTLAFTSGNNVYKGVLSNSGPLVLNLPASTVLTLQGNSSPYSGAMTISNSGTVLVNNTAGSGTGTGPLTVLSGATLGGNGVIGGPVTVDGTLAPGTSPGTLTVSNNLVIDSGAVLQYELGTTSDKTVVSGNLTLDGTLNVADAGGFTNTTYTLFKYGGTLTDHSLTMGTNPNANFSYTIDTSVAGEVDLVVSNGVAPPPADPFVAWQLKYFTCTNCDRAQPDADPYGKGISNTNQFLVGLDPTNPASVFRITSVATDSSNNVLITWAAAGFRTNAVQATSGDANGNYATNFTDITTSPHIVILNNGDVTTNYLDVGGATNSPSRYYRIRLVP